MKAIGLLYLAILFLACFAVVHVVKLAWIGLKSVRGKQQDAPEDDNGNERDKKPKKNAEPDKRPEPVYYIVEKKRSRSRANYSPPREIKFKDGK